MTRDGKKQIADYCAEVLAKEPEPLSEEEVAQEVRKRRSGATRGAVHHALRKLETAGKARRVLRPKVADSRAGNTYQDRAGRACRIRWEEA